mgnify:CR=1 FL=1
MARKIIDIGVKGNDGTGDPIRDAFRKINDNFQELYTSLGLVQGLTIISLSDTPGSYVGQANGLLAVNQDENAMIFKQIVGGTGIGIDLDSNPNEIIINANFADVSIDTSPQLGGPLAAISGGQIYPIGGLPNLDSTSETADALNKLATTYSTIPQASNIDRLAVNKSYADGKISLAGVDAVEFKGIDGEGNPIVEANPDFGIMTGPLVLSRDPITEDDLIWEGRTAATKRYVDGASYFSRINLHVSTTGNDARDDIAEEKQGRALAYAFRTVEAACKKAEELMNEAPLELGPYRKVLTYNNGAEFSTLTSITTSVNSGNGCIAVPVLSLDTFELNSGGSGYKVNDIVNLTGGVGTDQAAWLVTSVTEAAGVITGVRLLKSGVYTTLPGVTAINTTTNSTFGSGARFNATYKVTAVNITDGGTGYGLASLRILGGGGSGAFGFVDIVNGVVQSATITSQGSGYTDEPTVIVELPTLRIFTNGLKTDFTGLPGPGRDIREGLYIRGETSGALANILAHDGSTDLDGNELFDVDIVSGSFVLGERLSYGDPVKELQITIFVESGIYEENYPIKVPPNVSIKGDEFRRSIIRPRAGMSTSPYAVVNFRRDPVIDGLTVATQPFGYHYLTDSTQRIVAEVDNKGGYRSAKQIIKSNRKFIQDETIAWINAQILAGNEPFATNFVYNQALCKRDVGLIIDAIAYDIRWGGDNRTVSAALKYYQNASALLAITTQLDETVAAIEYVKYLVDQCLNGLPPAVTFTDTPQVLDPAFVAEVGTTTIAADLFDTIIDIVSNPSGFNQPKDNLEMDVFLMNDATILRNLTIQGHGGFAMVLDPDGQILTKSPYAQVGTVISGSTGFHRFAGGLFIDGFCGNVEFEPISKVNNFTLNVGGLVRKPQTPFSFQVDGVVYRVNYIRNYQPNPAGGTAQFVLDETTPYTPTILGSEVFEAITAGNRSMLSNDFTQINDMGYGILATNGGLTEAVGMFTYYCYTAFYALNGAQIRSVGGSSANGVYALKAEGSDPLEVPLQVTLYDDVTQGATVYAEPGFENSEGGLFIYIDNYSYVPYNQCQLEIDHSGIVSNYSVINVESGGTLPAGVAKLNLSSAASSGAFTGSLLAAVPNNTPVTIRIINQLRLGNVVTAFGTRPSTALIFDETPDFVYRVNSVSTGGQPSGLALAVLRESYQYLNVQVFPAQPANHGGVGNDRIAIGAVPAESAGRVIGLQFGWKGTVYTITDYDTPAETGQEWGRIVFTPTLAYTVSGFTPALTLRLGSQADQPGNITIKISTARFTGHDLLDIGTGSYADTNFPTVIYGEPANPRNQENEVQEVGKGRVFYVTTDQDGNFRVGPFFSIDQGSGSVTFSADLALSNLDGIGFKRGVTVSEFSTDDTMADNATDTVPTELAVRAYIDRRLGITHNGGIVPTSQLIPIDSNPVTNTSGFMALSGQLPMKGELDLGAHRIINIQDPVNAQDGVTKTWTRMLNLQDGTLNSPANQDLIMFTGTAANFVNVGNNTSAITNTSTARSGGSDISLSRSGNSLTIKLVGGQGSANPITDFHVNNDAEIQQSKLLMQLATERGSAPTGTARQKQATAGLASFKNNEFTVTDGFVELETATNNSTGVGLNKITWLNGRSVVGNTNVATAAASNVLMTDIVDLGGAIKKSLYSTNGFLRRSGVANTNDTDYTVVDESVASVGNTLVKRDTNGDFQARTITVSNLRVDDKIAIDSEALTGTDTGVIKMYAYRGTGGILLGDGANSSDKVNFYDNELHKFRTLTGFRGTIEVGTITTGAAGTSGTLIGSWSLNTTSNLTLGTGTIDARTGTLQSLTLTTGSAGTAGTLTGAWTLNGTSSLTLQSGGVIDATRGSLRSTTLDAGLPATAATIEGTWSLTSNSSLSPGSGTITATKAGLVTLVATDTASSTHYLNFTASSSGDAAIRTDTNLTYNPGTNTLSAVWFSGSFLGNATTATDATKAAKTENTAAAGSDVDLVYGTMGSNDQARIRIGGASNAGYIEIATADDGTEPIYVRQYTGVFTTLTRTATLLDGSGNTSFPGTVTAPTFSGNLSGNATSATTAGTITDQANSATITAATANTANTIVLRDVNGNFSAGVMTGTATAARYADLAERYASDKEYKPGTVVIFGGDKEITQSSKYMDRRVAGVISTNPAHLMNAEAGTDKTHPAVALTGRVPCRVVGKIQKGDLLVTSYIAGVAVACENPSIGTVIGKALENYDNDHIGTIEIVVGRH